MTETRAAQAEGEAPELQAIKLKLANYYGPLDLLLQLVKEDEVDILKVRLTEVVDQYIRILEAARSLNMDLAGEFLAISSQLLLLKARRIVPPASAEEAATEEQAEEITVDLIRKLLEYKQFKELAAALEERAERFGRCHGRPEVRIELPEGEVALVVDLWKLVASYARVAQAIRLESGLQIYPDIPIEGLMDRIVELIRTRGNVTFRELMEGLRDRLAVIGNFLALLQLIKDLKVEAETSGNDLVLRLKE